MQISKFFHFVLILLLKSGKVTKVPVKKLSTSEVISKKPHWGGGGVELPQCLWVSACSKFWGLSGLEDGVAVTTVSNSLILGGWVTKVLKNGDKNRGVKG